MSEENKKGLRVIKTIIDVKGMKRFKMGNTANSSLSAVKTKNALSKDNVNCLELEEAREFFRK